MDEQKSTVQLRKEIRDLELANQELEKRMLKQAKEFRQSSDRLKQQAAERALHLTQQKVRLQAITENIPGVVFQFYANKKGEAGVHYVSPKLSEIFGIEFIEDGALFFQKFTENIHEEDKPIWLKSIQEAVVNQHPWKWKGRYVKPSGEKIWFEGHSIPTVRADEIIFDGIFIDISDTVKQETALRQAKEGAESANKAKTEFLANMSHEMRTPMHAMLGFANVGRKHFEKAPRQRLGEYFSLIHESGERLLSFLTDLFDLATLDGKKDRYTFRSYDLNLSVISTITEVQFELQRKNIHISFQEELPHMAHFDRQKIIQVLHNLVNNAVKFSKSETTIEISIEEVDIEGALFQRLTVKDQGIGLPATELETVFDRFNQSSRTKTGAGGSGLGLAICRGIMDAHSGEIWAENNPEGGATFYFVLPVAPPRHNS